MLPPEHPKWSVSLDGFVSGILSDAEFWESARRVYGLDSSGIPVSDEDKALVWKVFEDHMRAVNDARTVYGFPIPAEAQDEYRQKILPPFARKESEAWQSVPR